MAGVHLFRCDVLLRSGRIVIRSHTVAAALLEQADEPADRLRITPANVASRDIMAGEVGPYVEREAIGMQPNELVDTFGKPLHDGPHIAVEQVIRFNGSGMALLIEEVTVKVTRAECSREFAPGRKQEAQQPLGVILRLNVTETEGSGSEVLSADVRDAVIRSSDLDLPCHVFRIAGLRQ